MITVPVEMYYNIFSSMRVFVCVCCHLLCTLRNANSLSDVTVVRTIHLVPPAILLFYDSTRKVRDSTRASHPASSPSPRRLVRGRILLMLTAVTSVCVRTCSGCVHLCSLPLALWSVDARRMVGYFVLCSYLFRLCTVVFYVCRLRYVRLVRVRCSVTSCCGRPWSGYV